MGLLELLGIVSAKTKVVIKTAKGIRLIGVAHEVFNIIWEDKDHHLRRFEVFRITTINDTLHIVLG